MAEYVKRATASHAAPNPQVTETVSTILGEIEHEGLPAIRAGRTASTVGIPNSSPSPPMMQPVPATPWPMS